VVSAFAMVVDEDVSQSLVLLPQQSGVLFVDFMGDLSAVTTQGVDVSLTSPMTPVSHMELAYVALLKTATKWRSLQPLPVDSALPMVVVGDVSLTAALKELLGVRAFAFVMVEVQDALPLVVLDQPGDLYSTALDTLSLILDVRA